MIAVFDNFIKDTTLLKEIEQNKTELFKEPGVFKWYDGWWNSPTTIDARKQFTDQYARTVSNPVRFLAKALQF